VVVDVKRSNTELNLKLREEKSQLEMTLFMNTPRFTKLTTVPQSEIDNADKSKKL
jgi:hypothetical protein